MERPRFELPSSSLFVDPEPGLIFREEYEDYTREVWAGDFPRDNLNLPNNDSELTLATSPSSNQLHTISVDPKAVLHFKTRGHCGEVDCVEAVTENLVVLVITAYIRVKSSKYLRLR